MIIIFVCVANSARSQMAEGLARHTAPPGITVFSAGSEPSRINPYAVRALEEWNIEIGDQVAKGFADVPLDRADVVITLCAEENCPVLPAATKKISWAMADPAAQADDDETKLQAFRATRDRIAKRLQAFWRELDSN